MDPPAFFLAQTEFMQNGNWRVQSPEVDVKRGCGAEPRRRRWPINYAATERRGDPGVNLRGSRPKRLPLCTFTQGGRADGRLAHKLRRCLTGPTLVRQIDAKLAATFACRFFAFRNCFGIGVGNWPHMIHARARRPDAGIIKNGADAGAICIIADCALIVFALSGRGLFVSIFLGEINVRQPTFVS